MSRKDPSGARPGVPGKLRILLDGGDYDSRAKRNFTGWVCAAAFRGSRLAIPQESGPQALT
jgi:hypothetical protein